MKYIVDAIVKDIVNQIESSNEQLRIRLNDFIDIRIYESVSRILHNKYDDKLKIITKLSEEKWNEFNKDMDVSFSTAFTSMEDNLWIAKDNSLTYYRNLSSDEADVIIIMGTEIVDDQGGLHDCYDINPLKIYQSLESNFSSIFTSINGEWEDYEKNIINKLIGDLFLLVPAQICKLSDYADKYGTFDSIESFYDIFFANLSIWGLCDWKEDIPSISSISKLNKRNIFQENYDFITRKKYKKMSKSSFLGVKNKLETYRYDNRKYGPNWNGWNEEQLKSYDLFCKCLEEYVLGANIETNKALLKKTDFSITKDILDLKLKKTYVSKDKTNVIKGDPLNAFLKAFNITVQNLNDYNFDELEINLESISLVDAIEYDNSDTEGQQLALKWRKICCLAGGVINFIKKWGILCDEDSIDISDPIDFLNPQNASKLAANHLIEAASSNKKLNKVRFSLSPLSDGELSDKNKVFKFEWSFSNSDTWTLLFDPVFSIVKKWDEDGVDSSVPVFSTDDYAELLNANNEVEFIDILKQTDIKSCCNILTKCEEDNRVSYWYKKFLSLGYEYVECCRSICNEGFFSCINNINSPIYTLNTSYEVLGEELLGVPPSEVMSIESILDCYIHAFIIEKDGSSIENSEYVKGCIVPPYHPATLQKLADKSVFIMDGYYQWSSKNLVSGNIENILYELDNLSDLQNNLDIFLTNNGTFIGVKHNFANYSLFGESGVESNKWLQNILQKEEVFDDDFEESAFKQMNASANMIYDVLNDYKKALPNNGGNLSIAIIDPLDLQPFVAAINKFVEYESKERAFISIKINILVKPDNKGGKNYLSYWINSYFSQDDNIDIKIYFNEWENNFTLEKLLDNNLDIIFVMNVLNTNIYDFIANELECLNSITDCRYPMVFKPIPVSNKNDAKRKIELSQAQFKSSYIHSQVVYYRQNYGKIDKYTSELVIKEVMIDKSIQERLNYLHEKTNWVVCVDSSMDGALLRQNTSTNYDVIGFSTGKGMHGKYNLTITSRKSLIDAIKVRLKDRLFKLFHWNEELLEKAADLCMCEAYKLDGVSLLKAINPKDRNIHEFLAYVLTSLSLEESKSDLKIVIHLDSYKHWFENEKFGDINNDSCSRPDFLLISAVLGEEKIKLNATVIECKMASKDTSDIHKEKALKQVKHGIERLSGLFNPETQSIKRRYWFSQLYRALSFSETTFFYGERYRDISSQLRNILDGNFEIEWNGKVMGYWLDLCSESTQVTISDDIEVYDIPQKIIQKILLGECNENIDFVPYREFEDSNALENIISIPLDKVEKEENNRSQDVVIETEIKDEKESNELEIDNINCQDVKKETTNKFTNETTSKNLNDVRVYLGKSSLGEPVYWEFGNDKLANRHLLITGTSGQGKTYCIQSLLKELADNSISSVIFDYTEGFKTSQLEKEFLKSLEGKICQKVVYFDGVPINPFRRQQIEFDGNLYPEKISDVAQRIANIFKHVYEFGDQQFSAVYEACRSGIEKYGDDMDMLKFKKELEESSNKASKTVLSKMAPFINSVEFKSKDVFDWNNVIDSNGTVTIFQLTNYVREIQVIITEMMLWDAWHYFTRYGNKDNPFVVVLDEAQNLSIKDNSPAQIILREGRKFGWSAWFATQSLKSLSDEEVVNLHQAPFSFYFKPTEDEIIKMARQIDPSNSNDSNRLVRELQNLNKGQCIIAGDRIRNDGTFGLVKPTVTSIASFEER